MILLIDNYDSFSYNLYQLVGEINPDIKVIRNDEMTVEEIAALAPDHIILSPGPGRPEDAGIIIEAARTLGRTIPTLGVCLGHQAICAAFGAANNPSSVSTLPARSSRTARRRRRLPAITRSRLTPRPSPRNFGSPPSRTTAR